MSKRVMVLFVVLGVLAGAMAANGAPPPPTVKAVHQTMAVKLPAPPLWKYGPVKPELKLMPGAMKAITAQTVKKQIFCGLWFPPEYTPALFFINNTGQVFPPGTVVQWQVTGEIPALNGTPHVFSGWTAPTNVVWAPNPPAEVWYHTGPLMSPAQHWSRPCQAWAILP